MNLLLTRFRNIVVYTTRPFWRHPLVPKIKECILTFIEYFYAMCVCVLGGGGGGGQLFRVSKEFHRNIILPPPPPLGDINFPLKTVHALEIFP